MLSRLRPTTGARSDKGFTLIELLVVMIIIGILAAIAIPVFLNQRTRAIVSSMESDGRRIATEVETVFVDDQSYPTVAVSSDTITVGGVEITLSDNNVAEVEGGADDYCVRITRAADSTAGDELVFYDSTAGGLTDVAC